MAYKIYLYGRPEHKKFIQQLDKSFSNLGFEVLIIEDNNPPVFDEKSIPLLVYVINSIIEVEQIPKWTQKTRLFLINFPIKNTFDLPSKIYLFQTITDNSDDLVREIISTSTETLQYDIDWTKLQEREFLSLLTQLLEYNGFNRIVKFDGMFSHLACFSRNDNFSDVYEERWLVVNLKHDQNISELKELLHVKTSYLREAILARMGIPDAQIYLPYNQPICLLIITRNRFMKTPVWVYEIRSMFPGRITVWDGNKLEELVSKQPELLSRYFSPISDALAKTISKQKELLSDKQGLIDSLKRTNQEVIWEQNRRAKAERDAIWKELSDRVAHKLGNPISTMGLIRRNLKSYVQDDGKKLLESLQRNVESANDILQEFRNYVKATGVKLESMASKNLINMLHEVSNDIQESVQFPKSFPKITLKYDKIKLKQVVEELFSNAKLAKQDQAEDLQFNFSFRKTSKNKKYSFLKESQRYFMIEIFDNGPGIPEEIKEKIFMPFCSTRKDGTGQGLSIVRKIIDDHSGYICEDGPFGKGASFKIFLPIIETEQEK